MADRWYVRLGRNNAVIHGFSDDFEAPKLGDICINENGGRHFTLQLFDENDNPIYEWDGVKLIVRTEKDTYPLEEIKEKKIEQLTYKIESSFEEKYNVLKRLAAVMGELSKEESDQMLNDLRSAYSSIQTKTSQINAAKTTTEVENIEI